MKTNQSTAQYNTEEYSLQIIEWQQEFNLSDEFVNDIGIKQYRDEFIGMTRFRFLKKIASDERQTEFDVYFDIPKNWFQHLLHQIGIQHKTKQVSKKVTFKEQLLFPNLPIKNYEPCQVYFKRMDLSQ